jgi:hypothetical protein
MPAKKTWIVLTSGDEPIEKIAEKLEEKGFTVESTLEAIGQIIGQGSEETKNEALKIKGVTDIYSSHDDINIGPPGSDLTW